MAQDDPNGGSLTARQNYEQTYGAGSYDKELQAQMAKLDAAGYQRLSDTDLNRGGLGQVTNPNAYAVGDSGVYYNVPAAVQQSWRTPSSDGFLSGLPGALNDMKGGLAVALGGPALGAGITSLAAPAAAGTLGAMTAPAGLSEEAAALGTGGASGAGSLASVAGTGAAGDTGAFDMFGSMNGPGSDATIFGGTAGNPMPASLMDMINQLPASAAGAVKSLVSSGGTTSDIMSLIGKLAPAALGAFASNQQAGALGSLADKYLAIGAPSRARYEASFAPGFDIASADPGYSDALAQTTKETLNRLSTGGNPAGSPNAWNQTLTDVNTKFALPALQNYRSQNAATGGLASLTANAPSLDTASVNANNGVYNSIGAGAADIFNPQPKLADLAKQLKAAGVF